MEIKGTPPVADEKTRPLVQREPTVAEKSQESVARQAEAAREKSTEHVQRNFLRIVQELTQKLAADGAAVSIKAGIGGEPIIVVTDRYTGEVIREIPPEEMRRLAQKMEHLQGVFFIKTA